MTTLRPASLTAVIPVLGDTAELGATHARYAVQEPSSNRAWKRYSGPTRIW
jgi:hypothetical protein